MQRLTLFFFIALSFQGLFGQANWKVTPMYFNLTANKGDRISRSFTIFNASDEPQSYRVISKDWIFTKEGNDKELEPGSFSRGCAEWLSGTPQNFSLQPKGSKQVRFTVEVPQAHLPGTYWSAFFIEPADKPDLGSSASGEGRTYNIYVKVRAKVSILITLPGQQRKDGKVTNLEVEVGPLKENIKVTATFNNTGNLYMRCKGTVEIRDYQGETIESFPLKSFASLPETESIIVTDHPMKFNDGEYSALVIIDFDGDFLIAGEAFFDVTE